jgi:undecaprenyl-phosphate 4-deoxy-4-formamido-L-arabinose transferase
MSLSLLSVVIPVYRSESTLGELYAQLSKTLTGRIPFEVIFVEDGSPDASWQKIQQLKRDHPKEVVAVKFSRNFGQHNAIACGFGFAKGDMIVTMDDDLQHPPSEIIKLLDRYEETGADLVYGEYVTKQHSQWRNAGSGLLKSGSRIIDGRMGFGSSFRLIRQPIAVKVASHVQTGFLFIDEVAQWYTSNITSVAVEHHPRRSGRSTYTGRKLFSMYFDILINYSATPLKLMTWFGLLSSIVTFLLGLRFIYNKLAHGSTPGFTATIVTVLFSTSILMLCMGIVGQYMFKLYQLQNRRPQYHIERVL